MKIAIIEDDRSVAGEIGELLLSISNDIDYFIFSSAELYFDYINNNEGSVDVIIMDFNLEEEYNGLTLAEDIIKNENAFKGLFVFYTGMGGVIFEMRLKFSKVKNYKYLKKGPDSLKELEEIIEEMVDWYV